MNPLPELSERALIAQGIRAGALAATRTQR